MKVIQVINIETGECVKEIDVTGKSESMVDRVEMGLLINMNTESYFTKIVDK